MQTIAFLLSEHPLSANTLFRKTPTFYSEQPYSDVGRCFKRWFGRQINFESLDDPHHLFKEVVTNRTKLNYSKLNIIMITGRREYLIDFLPHILNADQIYIDDDWELTIPLTEFISRLKSEPDWNWGPPV